MLEDVIGSDSSLGLVSVIENRRMFYFAPKYVISITYGAKWGKEEAAAT